MNISKEDLKKHEENKRKGQKGGQGITKRTAKQQLSPPGSQGQSGGRSTGSKKTGT